MNLYARVLSNHSENNILISYCVHELLENRAGKKDVLNLEPCYTQMVNIDTISIPHHFLLQST